MSVTPFQRALDEHGGAVWRACAAAAGRDDAEDAFQETWIAALRAWPSLPETANVRAWLLTIARHKAIDTHRGRARQPVPAGDALPEPVAPEPPVRDEALWAAVAALPAGQRAAVTLRFAGDLTHAEIATTLAISEEAARRRLADGLNRLREETDR